MIYKIKKGEHHSRRFPSLFLWKKRLHYSVVFNLSAIYQTIEPTNQFDINKLIGFADGFKWGKRQIYQSTSKGWKNSARIGWRWAADVKKLEILAYTYTNGKLQFDTLGFVAIGERFEVVIQKVPGKYQYLLFSKEAGSPGSEPDIEKQGYELIEHSRTTKGGRILGFKQFFYFGGNETAPHDITAEIKSV
jgi:hypothetical protein